MTDALAQRCALAILLAALVATAAGLLAWGPVPLVAETHGYADERGAFGLANAWNVLANGPLLVAALYGLQVESRSDAPLWLRRSRQAFHASVGLGAVAAAIYHLMPGNGLYLATQVAMAAGFLMLTGAVLGERVHPGFASPMMLGAAALAPIVAAGAAVLVGSPGPTDLWPLLLLQIMPVLVVPAGALGLPGSQTRAGDWIVLLVIYALARACHLSDATILTVTGGVVSGHTLMHLGFAVATAWLAYCTASRVPEATAAGIDSQRRTSLNTDG
jgi:hypothetical protein